VGELYERVFYYNTNSERSLSWACIISSSNHQSSMQ